MPNVAEIEDFAFYECSELTSVTMSKSLKKIGECAFAHCSSISSIEIPDSVTVVGEGLSKIAVD